MMKKKILPSAVAMTFVAGLVASVPAHAVRMSENGAGQVLLGTQYVLTNIAGGENYTNNSIRVLNPNTTNAVKAKLVLRSKKYSLECFDTVLYLSPGDVAVVNLSVNSTAADGAVGKLRVTSQDDSILSRRLTDGTLVFASQMDATGKFIAPFAKVVDENTLASFKAANVAATEDTCLQGHIEVVGAYAAQDLVSVSAGAPVQVIQGMSKHNLARIFDTSKSQLNALNANTTRITNNSTGFADRETRVDDYSRRVQLSGVVEISKADDRLLTPLIALREGINPNTTSLSTPVISNPVFDVTVGSETFLGSTFDDALTTNPSAINGDNINDIEAALATSSLRGFYENVAGQRSVLAALTFPTKYRHILGAAPFTGKWGEPFYNDASGSIAYGATLFDEQERSGVAGVGEVCVVSPCPIVTPTGQFLNHEVNFPVVISSADGTGFNPANGWYNMVLTGVGGLPRYSNPLGGAAFTAPAYAGIPTIGYTHYYQIVGGRISRSVVEPLVRNNNVDMN
ncbi:hypothetical protein [Chitinimonas lacunae]|uniref:Uncharacterized protein n=1 Tax=Chitinimonas lacunae TaxID=1963018 RepID=A0ABV8MVN7_9NEIS